MQPKILQTHYENAITRCTYLQSVKPEALSQQTKIRIEEERILLVQFTTLCGTSKAPERKRRAIP